MKNVIKILICIISISFISGFVSKNSQCEKSQELNMESIISPSGLLIAKSKYDLKMGIQEHVDLITGERTSFEISSLKFHEYEKYNVVSINFITEKKLESNILLVNNIHESNYGIVNGYTVSCIGCSGCRVIVTDNGNGSFSNSCTNPCCMIRVSKDLNFESNKPNLKDSINQKNEIQSLQNSR